MAERSSSSATMSRTRCAGCPSGTNSCTEGGSSQASSTCQGRKLFVMPPSESPPPRYVEPPQPLPGQAPSEFHSRLPRGVRRGPSHDLPCCRVTRCYPPVTSDQSIRQWSRNGTLIDI